MVIEKPNIRLLKNRDSGVMKVVECAYCGDSRRIYQLDKGDLQRFGWNKEGLKKPSVLANSDPRYGIFLSEAPLVQPQPF